MTLLYYALASLLSICGSTVSSWLRSLCISLLYAKRRCVYFIDLKGTASIRLASQWYVIMMYWFELRAWMGNLPVSSVYNLLMGVTCMNSSFERIQGIGLSGELVVGSLGLVDLTPWYFWTRCTMIVAAADGQYLVALVSVSPNHEE